MSSAQVVREFLSLLETDPAAAARLLHHDVEWRNTGLPTLRGRRVGSMLRDMGRRGIGLGIELHHLAHDGSVVLTDRTDTLSYGRFTTSFWVRGTFEVAADSTIRLWDDAFSWAAFTRGSLVGAARAVLPR